MELVFWNGRTVREPPVGTMECEFEYDTVGKPLKEVESTSDAGLRWRATFTPSDSLIAGIHLRPRVAVSVQNHGVFQENAVR